MSIAAGVLSVVSVTGKQASLSSTAASGGTGPYTQQWYMSTTDGFSPAGGNLISGATALTLLQTGLIPNTVYYFKVIYTDTGHSNDTITSDQLTVTTAAQNVSQNQFALEPFAGQVDLIYAPSTFSVQISPDQATSIFPGQAVKVVNSTSGVPQVVSCDANSDEVWGYVNYDIKTVEFLAGSFCEVSRAGNIMYLWSTTAIARGARVTSDVVNNGVSVLVGSSGANIVGEAYDDFPNPGTLGRVLLKTSSFQTA